MNIGLVKSDVGIPDAACRQCIPENTSLCLYTQFYKGTSRSTQVTHVSVARNLPKAQVMQMIYM